MTALATVPADISDARLPAVYEAAKVALANCASLDECKDWSDKAAALASYAEQSNDETLMKQATRIRARAIRRMGELLEQQNAQGRRTDRLSAGADTKLTQREAAEQAGISKRQQVTAVRVANIPTDAFEAAIESDATASITKLAEMGTRPKPLIDLKGRDPTEFNRAMHFVGPVEEYAKVLARADLAAVLPILNDREKARLRAAIGQIDSIHDVIVTRI